MTDTEYKLARPGDWMQTFTGRRFWPIDPRPEEIYIEDIAHALGMACRYAGHCLRFYSVAEHSVWVSRNVPKQYRLWGLLHDASEAYIVDVPRPLKPSLTDYRVFEDRVMRAVALRFGLLPHSTMPAEVKEADNRILVDEKDQNMAPGLTWYAIGDQPLGVELEFWSPAEAERRFLAEFRAITSEDDRPRAAVPGQGER